MKPAMKPPYNQVKDAYQHMLGEDRYQPYERHDDGDWVVVFFKETGKCRLFPTLEAVGNWYNWCIYRENVFTKPEHFAERFTTLRLRALLFNGQAPELTSVEMSRMLWKQCQETGDKVNTFSPSEGTRGDKDKYTIRVDLILDDSFAETISGLPKQAKIILTELGANKKSGYTEDEMESFARNLVLSGKLKTKQDGFRVCRYYFPVFAENGFMEYEGRRTSEELAA